MYVNINNFLTKIIHVEGPLQLLEKLDKNTFNRKTNFRNFQGRELK